MTKKGLFAIFLIIALLFLVVSANALPKIFPNVQFPIGGNQGDMFGDYEIPKPGPRISFLKQTGNKILICKAPAGYDWSEFDKGKSQCLLPDGTVMAGDVIKNCEGTVTIIHKATNEIAITATFDTPLTDDEKEKQDTDNQKDDTQNKQDDQNNPDTQDTGEFKIKITKPMEKKSYIRDINLKEGSTTLIIGHIEVETEVTNPENIEIDKVVFSIDGDEKYTDDEGPTYQWTWDEKIFGKHTIKVAAYHNDKLLDDDEIKVRILNFDVL